MARKAAKPKGKPVDLDALASEVHAELQARPPAGAAAAPGGIDWQSLSVEAIKALLPVILKALGIAF